MSQILFRHSLVLAFRVFLIFFMLSVHPSFGQSIESSRVINYFGGSVAVTNNGISLLPTFSLGKPAGILDMKVGKKLTFEPQFRFSLRGKPWSFIFWWCHKLLSTERFRIRVGAHPALLFKTIPVTSNGVTSDRIMTQRYLAAELAPNYHLTKNISIGVYYLKSHGFEEDATKNTDFVTINCNFSNIKLSEQFLLKFYPQFYYLRMDERDGIYFTSTLTLVRKDFSLSLQAIINKIIQTDILSDNFVWNGSLIYSFGSRYVAIK